MKAKFRLQHRSSTHWHFERKEAASLHWAPRHYCDRTDLRRIIQAAQNKCEGFNRFAQWAYFGADPIAENVRDEQVKIIKYNHLIAKLVIYATRVIGRVLELRLFGEPGDQAPLTHNQLAFEACRVSRAADERPGCAREDLLRNKRRLVRRSEVPEAFDLSLGRLDIAIAHLRMLAAGFGACPSRPNRSRIFSSGSCGARRSSPSPWLPFRQRLQDERVDERQTLSSFSMG
ncbi:Tn3 family transposase [Variovorax sp. RTB1]|uniref:Tn3 family transposase n=1 Tax=Variovorax sp. RTB1 TaxID=3048631 RepID=UPI002B22C65A|nr:Tn3 family transposase [Variovorax sp. RTB1]